MHSKISKGKYSERVNILKGLLKNQQIITAQRLAVHNKTAHSVQCMSLWGIIIMRLRKKILIVIFIAIIVGEIIVLKITVLGLFLHRSSLMMKTFHHLHIKVEILIKFSIRKEVYQSHLVQLQMQITYKEIKTWVIYLIQFLVETIINNTKETVTWLITPIITTIIMDNQRH